MSELSPDLIRRVLITVEFDNCDSLFWRYDSASNELSIYAQCSDFFDWGSADAEPIESENDVLLLEQCLADLFQATGRRHSMWLTALYASRRRKLQPAQWFMDTGSKYYLGDVEAEVFQRHAAI